MFQNFSENKDLRSFFKVLSTNTDRNGKEFISSMEGNKINYRLYLHVHVLCNISKSENIFNMVLPIGILCLTCDLDIDLQFIYRYITLKTSMDHILIIFPQHMNILYTLYSGIQRKTTLYGSQKLTSTMMPMPSEYLSILQIFL